ncbi:MAG TPA: phosphate-starvation-inducible PsiE family protein [Acidiferrobacter sp.]|nr:phosphate-starvation-inducible PsiE family protein [Acidiferrobacter sp.]
MPFLLIIFEKVVDWVLGLMLVFVLFGIIIGVGHLFMDLAHIITRGHITSQYLEFVGHVLTLFVLIEISRSLVSYFTVHRLRMTYIVDAALVFVLRNVMIGLFEKSLPTDSIYALSVLIFVLGALRTAAVVVFQREKPITVSVAKTN